MMVNAAAEVSLGDLIDGVDGRVACWPQRDGCDETITMLLFPPGQPRPGLVAKVPTTDGGAIRLAREAARLGVLEQRGLGAISATVPRLVQLIQHRDRPVLVTTALPGRNMIAASRGLRRMPRPVMVAADFEAARRWLAALHAETASGTADLARMLDGVAERIARRFGADCTASDSAHIATLANRLSGHQVACGIVHGEFVPSNLLLTKDGEISGVIDWQESPPDGPVVTDMTKFAIDYSGGCGTRRWPRIASRRGNAGVPDALSGTGWYPNLVRSFVADALERAGVSGNLTCDVLQATRAASAAAACDRRKAWRYVQLFRRFNRTSRSLGPETGLE